MLAFIASFIVLIIIGYITYDSVQSVIADNEIVLHTQDVLDGVQDVQRTLLQTETDARGYLLTGSAVFQEVYERHRHDVPRDIARLRQLVSDNPAQRERVDTLERAVTARLDLLHEYVQRRQVLGLNVITDDGVAEGKRRMDAVNGALADLSSTERELLEARLQESRRKGRQLSLTVVLAVSSVAILLGLVFFLANRDLRYRQANEDRLKAARDELEQRVIERTSELTDLNTELERSNRELQDFAFVASHDLQEPLRKIQAFGDRLSTVQGPKFDDQGRDYLERMQSAAERMHTLINDLLTFSRVTTKAQPFERTNLSKVANEVVDDLETTIEQAGGEVRIGKLPTIDADALQMRQLFQNLIANALKFRKPDTHPVVEVLGGDAAPGSPDGDLDFAKVLIRDNGIGFDEKYLDRIFTPFQRLHGRNEYEGTGIGLAVCRKIVERHGGTLTAESKVGEGATFIVTLPVSQAKEK
ncbi:MAG TPA: CHASE3 domain-containing protein [Pyrinomonadaceae bacterium]